MNISHIGRGQSDVQFRGHPARRSSAVGAINGLIVVKINGEGRGVTCRAMKPTKNMKKEIAVEEFLAGRRVVIVKFVTHRHKEVQNKAKKVVGIVNLYEVQCADGKAPTVQTWCPRSVQTIEQAVKECACTFQEGQKLVAQFDSMEPNHFDATNGVIIRAVSVLPLE